MQYLRLARINEAYSLGREMGEIWEIRLGEDSSNEGVWVDELKMPENSAILVAVSENKFIYNPQNYKLKAFDKLILYVSPADIKDIERIFYR